MIGPYGFSLKVTPSKAQSEYNFKGWIHLTTHAKRHFVPTSKSDLDAMLQPTISKTATDVQSDVGGIDCPV